MRGVRVALVVILAVLVGGGGIGGGGILVVLILVVLILVVLVLVLVDVAVGALGFLVAREKRIFVFVFVFVLVVLVAVEHDAVSFVVFAVLLLVVVLVLVLLSEVELVVVVEPVVLRLFPALFLSERFERDVAVPSLVLLGEGFVLVDLLILEIRGEVVVLALDVAELVVHGGGASREVLVLVVDVVEGLLVVRGRLPLGDLGLGEAGRAAGGTAFPAAAAAALAAALHRGLTRAGGGRVAAPGLGGRARGHRAMRETRVLSRRERRACGSASPRRRHRPPSRATADAPTLFFLKTSGPPPTRRPRFMTRRRGSVRPSADASQTTKCTRSLEFSLNSLVKITN